MEYCPICKSGRNKEYHNWRLHSEYWHERKKIVEDVLVERNIRTIKLEKAMQKIIKGMIDNGLDFSFVREALEDL